MSYFSLTKEREEELIERIAKFIVNNELTPLAEVLLQAYGVMDAPGNIAFLTVYPWATGIFGKMGQEVTELMGLNPGGSSKRILEKVRELQEEKERIKEIERLRRKASGQPTSFLEKLRSLFSRKK